MITKKKAKFNQIVKLLRCSGTIEKRSVQGFTVVANIVNFSGAEDLKSVLKKRTSLVSAFLQYNDPYKYLITLNGIEEIPKEDIHKMFAKINYKILNNDGFEVSGGERSEFNLLQEISDAQMYDMLLIDEPESSFDNIFLKNEVNSIIKDLSKSMPVVLITHNNTVGASINPDYLIYTRKEVVSGKIAYQIYAGFPTDKDLKSIDGLTVPCFEITLGCLEAGKETYEERKKHYENLKN